MNCSCSFSQIKFSFPLNIFHFLENFCTVYSNMQAWSVFYHNKVLCSFPNLFSNNSTFFPSVFIFFLFFGMGGGKKRSAPQHWAAFSTQLPMTEGMSKFTRARREKEVLGWDCPGWDTWIRRADCQGAREGTSGRAACPVMNLDGKKAAVRHKKKGTQVTQAGFQEQLILLSFLSTFSHFSQHLLFSSPLSPREAEEVWQPVSDGGLMERANCFLCFVQMYK